METTQVQKKAISLLGMLSQDDLKAKKYSSVTVAAIVHATRLLNLPVTMKQILDVLECCERQMKKVLGLL